MRLPVLICTLATAGACTGATNNGDSDDTASSGAGTSESTGSVATSEAGADSGQHGTTGATSGSSRGESSAATGTSAGSRGDETTAGEETSGTSGNTSGVMTSDGTGASTDNTSGAMTSDTTGTSTDNTTGVVTSDSTGASTGDSAGSSTGDTPQPCSDPGLVVFVCERGSPRGLAFGNGRLYWAEYNSNTILYANRDGTHPRLVPKPNDPGDSDAPLYIAVQGTNVYWTEPHTGRVRRVRDDGVTSVVATGTNPTFLSLNGTSVWWADTIEFGQIYRGQVPFGPATGQRWSGPWAVLADDTYFYVPGGRVRYYADGSQDPVQSFGMEAFRGLEGRFALDETHAYWVGYSVSDGHSYIVSAPLDGSAAPRTLAQITGALHSAVAIDDTDVYFLDPIAGLVRRIAKSGDPNTLETLAEDQARPYDILVDDSQVYWSNRGESNPGGRAGSVFAMAK